MKTRQLFTLFLVILLLLPYSAMAESELFSRMPLGGAGKQIVSIHSFSSQTKNEEGPVNMLLPDMAVNEDKWCDNSSSEPWVIFEFANYYNVDSLVITDAQIREKNNGNFDEYKIYVTNKPFSELINGWEDSDWTEVYYGVDEGSQIIKKIQLDNPVEARYLKLSILSKGYRPDNGNYENAIRIYGCDIYGSYSREVDRGDLISVGKTILKSQEGINKRETAVNILDGNITNKNSKWCFRGFGQELNYRYAIIDLEGLYDIDRFKIYDAAFVEEGTQNLDGVNIYVSRTAPNLGLINMIDDDPNTVWTKVVDSEFETDLEVKEYTYGNALWTAPVTGRFVKLEIPAYKAAGADPNGTSRVFQFEVYGSETVIPDNDATLNLLTVSEGTFSPDFSSDVYVYTVNVAKEIESIVLSASSTHKEATVTGDGVKNLEIGPNTFDVKVQSKDGQNNQTYTVTVNRAAKSKIATLQSLTASVGFMSPVFNADSTNYFVDVPYGTASISFDAVKTQEDAQIDGLGNHPLDGSEQQFSIVVTSEDGSTTKTYQVTVIPEEEGLISVNYGSPIGKRIVNVHSYSAKANDNENPYKVFLGERLNLSGDTKNKWCDNNTVRPWIILSLTDIYEISRIVIRDGKAGEASNANVANVSDYWIGVSTTGIDEFDFMEIASDWPDPYEDVHDIDYLQDEARYIKFEFGRGTKDNGDQAGAIWIYGIDIYGKKVEDIDRGDVVSVGKTIVDRSSNYSDRETACNILDGNIDYEVENLLTGEMEKKLHDPWAFNRSEGDGWVIIDLEREYYIDSLKLYETNDWIQGYEVLVNTTGNDAAWTEVFSDTFEPEIEEYEDDNWEIQERIVGPDPKVAKLEEPAKGRFVKLFFPLEMQSKGFNRIREVEVYGKPAPGSVDIVKGGGAASFVVYPNPVTQGNSLYLNETGSLTIFTLQGSEILNKEIHGAAHISTAALEAGSYILRLSNADGIKQAKLIVK
jgi:hypothetical protein